MISRKEPEGAKPVDKSDRRPGASLLRTVEQLG
jgi:hypothetical protein